MARPLRLDFAGAVWHLTSRGNGGQNVFDCDDDQLDFLALLAEAKRRFKWLILTFVHDRVNGSVSIWKDLAGGIYPGSEQWRAQIQKRIDVAPRSDEHPKAQRYVARPKMAQIVPVVAQVFELAVHQARSRRDSPRPTSCRLAGMLRRNAQPYARSRSAYGSTVRAGSLT